MPFNHDSPERSPERSPELSPPDWCPLVAVRRVHRSVGTRILSAIPFVASLVLISVAAMGGWRLAASSAAAPTELIVPVAAGPVAVGPVAVGPVAFGSGLPASTPLAQQDAVAASSNVIEWTDTVWQAAQRGDVEALDRALSVLPRDADEVLAERLRGTLELRARNLAEADVMRRAEIDKAMAEVDEAIAADNLSEALAAAMAVQMLSDDWAAALRGETLAALVKRAEQTADEAQSRGDLLLAQEMFARLRLLHDGLDVPELLRRYQAGLEEANRRIGLIAHYAPARLHEMRRVQMARLAPEREFPNFDATGLEDWREQSSGITQPMLLKALRTAATEHIANEGWRPLLTGGLESMRIFATTPEIAESFPKLAEPERVGKWNEAVDGLATQVAQKRAQDVALGDYRRIIETLLRTNANTIAVPESVLLREFGDGAALKLTQLFDDQYTEMIWPERLRRFEQQTEGNFVGVGIMIRQNERREIIVVHPLEGSPAYRAGIRAEDRVVAVDGMSTFGWSLNKAVDTITGPRGRTVRLGIMRGGADGDEETIEVPVVRDTIKIRSVNGWRKTGLDPDGNPEWDWMIDPIGGIGYVRLTGFSEDSFDDFLVAVDAMRARGPLNGLVLDLRSNPGGLLRSAVQFSNLFVPRGPLVFGENKDGRVEWRQDAHPNRSDARLSNLPVVLLTNEAAASASEIVAGALQAYGAAIVVGERTFGKGSVQTVHDISDAGTRSAIKLTTQHYVLPARDGQARGRVVNRQAGATDWGVNPDIVVRMTPTQNEAALRIRQESDHIPNTAPGEAVVGDEDRPHPSELLTGGHDPQLQTALMLLQARALRVGSPVPAAAAANARRG